MRLCALLCILFPSSILLHAADLGPPEWRDSTGSTFQSWEFRFDQSATRNRPGPECSQPEHRQATPWGHRGAPDKFHNPFQQTTGICVEFRSLWSFSRHIDWQTTYEGREGIWKLENGGDFTNFLNFLVPGPGSPPASSAGPHILHIQMIYHSISGSPVVHVQYQTGTGRMVGNYPDPDEENMNVLPEGWLHHSLIFALDSCPRYESVFIYPPTKGQVYIDSVTIDTLCRGLRGEIKTLHNQQP